MAKNEPFSGLDPITKGQAMKLIGVVAAQDDLNTIIVTTHDVDSALAIADQLALLGRSADEKEKCIGSSIKKIYDLAALRAGRSNRSGCAKPMVLALRG